VGVAGTVDCILGFVAGVPGRLYVGTSGWDYPHWKESFYAGAPRKDWLRLYATKFGALEVNATFYHLLPRTTFGRWRDETPASFRFCIKGNRFLTHNKKLKDPEKSIALERDRASALGAKLAVVLWQTPRTLRKDLGRLRGFAQALVSWPEPRHALELRHEDWFTPDVADCLAEHRLAACLSDAADWPLWEAVTTDLVYVRLHGHEVTYASAYTAAQLRGWARRTRAWLDEGREVHVYFDNDARGRAPEDARRLLELLGRRP
jgi:uncharacterized protein YecE (DUF72 family)